MASVIKAGNATDGVQVTSDNTGILELKTGTGAGTTAVTVGTGQNVTFAQAANLPNTFGFKNRIINGGMVIDQRNAGASVAVTTSDPYIVDRWVCLAAANSRYTAQQNQGSVTPPAGFTNYLGTTSVSTGTPGATDVYAINQYIEGFNIADLGWGTANAQTVTLSFWVRSSLTGAFGGTINNSGSPSYRSYPFSFTISTANTWEQKTVTIPGDTSGTWATNNGVGIRIRFSLGVGSSYLGTAGAWAAGFVGAPTGSTNVVSTNGATFYITGVQLEKGSTATSFDYRPYGTELALCQRYYYRQTPTGIAYYGPGYNDSTTVAAVSISFPVPMRVAPSALEQSGTASHYRVQYTGTVANCSAVPQLNYADLWGGMVLFTVASGLTAGQGSFGRSNSTSGYLGFSAEL
jgi:hypothetical protein